MVIVGKFFTKWAEVEALAKIGQSKMKVFVWMAIACRFGVPQVLVTDNGTQFDGSLFL